jgi:hypothetical protein
MSKTAIITLYAVVFIVSVVFVYGKGYYQGRNSQITYASALEIAKSQFICKMESK